jgi:hypothetical protein
LWVTKSQTPMQLEAAAGFGRWGRLPVLTLLLHRRGGSVLLSLLRMTRMKGMAFPWLI